MPKINKTKEIILILEDIRSAYNVGSIFRTADAAGVKKIYITGYTPAPRDKFDRVRKDLAKVALGAERSVLWEQFENTQSLLKKLKKDGVQVVAVEQDKNSINYRKFKMKGDTAFIFGNETEGVPKNLLSLSDKIIEIPMSGMKESLNVAVSVGIILFGI